MIKINKILILVATLNLINANTTVKIYNQNKALFNQYKKISLEYKGQQNLEIKNLPKSIIPSSINLLSNDIDFISIEYFNNPINTQSILNTFIGKNVELVKYNNEGKISFSKMGKLISNINQPIFEIDGKIVINPPYEYRNLHL